MREVSAFIHICQTRAVNSHPMQKTITYEVEEIIHSTIEAAFKMPILGDATKILTYFGIPFVKGFIHDETWAQVNGTRIPLVPLFGRMGTDTVFVRDENHYWKWQVIGFGFSLLFFTYATGEWWCTDNNNGSVSVKWKYSFDYKNKYLRVFTMLYVIFFWKNVMDNGVKKIKEMAESGAEYLYK
ncbi:MAG: hypothetical protein JWN78_1379 [Bacteroidota bacterium]|nr:hypothetical protein [Bacteroidota bacterium]